MPGIVPEYMRVRSYLYNFILESEGRKKTIPPENELCRLFDVSRVTVRGAIKGLVEDNYLIPRRGLGTFINPDCFSSRRKRLLQVGIMTGAGNNVSNICHAFILDAVHQAGMDSQPVYMPDSGRVDSLIEILSKSVAAFIWFHRDFNEPFFRPYVKKLKEVSLPVLFVTETRPDFECDFVLSTCFDRGLVMADYLYSRGHRNTLFIHNDDSRKNHLSPLSTYSGYRKRMEKLTGKKIAEDSRAIAGLNSFIAKIRKNGKAFLEGFTSLYSSNSIIPWVKKELEHLEISVPEDISYISFNPSSSLFFDGLEPDYIDKNSPYRREISKWLKLKLIDCKPRNETFRKNAGANVVPGQTVRNLKKGGSK